LYKEDEDVKKAAFSFTMLFLISIALAGCSGGGHGNGNGVSFSLSNLTVKPTELNVNETVTISITVTNTGNVQGSREVTLIINDEQADSETVTLGPGNSQDVQFDVTPQNVGTYQIQIEELSSAFIVNSPQVYVEVELEVDATNPEGVRFVAPGDGSYEITIISGATCHILETDPNWSEYGGWRTSVALYVNKPIEWGEPEENVQYGLVPVNFDYRLGEGKYVPTIEEAEATGIGSSVTLDLAKNDYIIALEHDHFDYYYDNSGTITLLITGYYQE
jgi:hypothetical protein